MLVTTNNKRKREEREQEVKEKLSPILYFSLPGRPRGPCSLPCRAKKVLVDGMVNQTSVRTVVKFCYFSVKKLYYYSCEYFSLLT